MPSRSSRSWKASPTASPYAPSRVSSGFAAAGHRRADLERPAHRVVPRLASRDLQHLIQGRQAADVVDQVCKLADRQFAAHRVVARPGPAQSAVGRGRCRAASARPRPGTGRRAARRRTHRTARRSRTAHGRGASRRTARGPTARPRRSGESSMTSSCSSANACSSSRLAAARSAACGRLGAAQPSEEHEGRAQALAAADESDEHVGGDVDARAAQVDGAPIGDETVDRVEHRLAHVASPDLELTRDSGRGDLSARGGVRARKVVRRRSTPTPVCRPTGGVSASLFAFCPYPQSEEAEPDRMSLLRHQCLTKPSSAAWSLRDR